MKHVKFTRYDKKTALEARHLKGQPVIFSMHPTDALHPGNLIHVLHRIRPDEECPFDHLRLSRKEFSDVEILQVVSYGYIFEFTEVESPIAEELEDRISKLLSLLRGFQNG